MTIAPTRRWRHRTAEHPVELRFVDMLLIIIATLMFLAIVLSAISAFEGKSVATSVPRITTTSAPAAITAQSYALTLAVQGGDGQYTWRVAGGLLPPGLALDPTGIIHGTPTRPASTQLGVRVTDGSGRLSDVQELPLTVRPSGLGSLAPAPPRVVSAVTLLSGAVVGQQYSYVFKTDTGTPPDRWTSTAMPAGLQLAPDGTLAGQPQSAGASSFTVTVVDGSNVQVHQQVVLDVQDAPPSWFDRILGWLQNAAAYLFLAIFVGVLLFGAPASAPMRGILKIIFGSKKR